MGVERIARDPAAAVPDRLQRREAERGAPDAVLGLQRAAGNHAVSGLLQRASYGPKASGAPASWSEDVKKATAGTAADRFKLVASALTGVTVVDKTTDAASDAAVDWKHLVEYDSSKPAVSYDDNLNSKTGRADDGGFTKSPGGKKSFVVLGPKALRDSDFFFTRLIVNHEFNHVRQNASGSSLKGNDSEVDAWTSSFVSEFHRSYLIDEQGTSARINDYQTFTQLLGYYERSDVAQAVKDACVKKIEDYYDATIKPHAVHTAVFKFWLYRSLNGKYKALATILNADLKLGVDPSADLTKMRRIDLAEVKKATYPSGTTVSAP